jgi:hypothetical protein
VNGVSDVYVTINVDGQEFDSDTDFELFLDDLLDTLSAKYVDVDYVGSMTKRTAEVTFLASSD